MPRGILTTPFDDGPGSLLSVLLRVRRVSVRVYAADDQQVSEARVMSQ